ncbi:hypothetical protein [Mitsuaria sp. 7]|uniref:hypothetical protein n=1 Tax=Mitsuaria sp. 7 TaxID=1658665 RepID=UPI0007DD0494|nr:hypothetical protein [Mitsuaria sp. 7]ANH69419.1 hypothetical protein ABE85_20915 [Mitsuaria sp. 7]
MKKLLISGLMAAALGVAATNALAARSPAPLLEPERVTVTDAAGKAPGAEVLKDAIIRAGAKRTWQVREEKPGEVLLVLDKQNGKHEAVVSVTYDEASFQIKYVSSRDLLWGVKDGVTQIHPLYNGWVINLGKDIQEEVRR